MTKLTAQAQGWAKKDMKDSNDKVYAFRFDGTVTLSTVVQIVSFLIFAVLTWAHTNAVNDIQDRSIAEMQSVIKDIAATQKVQADTLAKLGQWVEDQQRNRKDDAAIRR